MGIKVVGRVVRLLLTNPNTANPGRMVEEWNLSERSNFISSPEFRAEIF